MSSKVPRLMAKEVVKQLKAAGFVEVSQTGSHLKLFNPETRRTAIVPIHSQDNSNRHVESHRKASRHQVFIVFGIHSLTWYP